MSAPPTIPLARFEVSCAEYAHIENGLYLGHIDTLGLVKDELPESFHVEHDGLCIEMVVVQKERDFSRYLLVLEEPKIHAVVLVFNHARPKPKL